MMQTFIFLQSHTTLALCLLGFFALFIGSFLNVVIYRLPMMMQREWLAECEEFLEKKVSKPTETFNLMWPWSRCQHCKQTLRPWQNIPIISYLILLGKCHNCKKPISLRYPLVELLTLILSIWVALHFGWSWKMLIALIVTWNFIAMTFIDIDHFLLPDQMTLSLVWLGLFVSTFSVFANMQSSILGAIFGYGIFAVMAWLFLKITKKEGMGSGDFKLLAGIGALLGWQVLPAVIFLACITGIVITLFLMFITRNFKSEPLPFGPYLAIAGWVCMMWAPHGVKLTTLLR